MKRAPRSHQHHDLYRKYHGQNSEIRDLLGECGIKTAICDNTNAIANCEAVLIVELTVIDRATYAMPDGSAPCVRRDDPSNMPSNQLDAGAGNQMVLIRSCAVIDRLLPFSGFGLNLVRDETGGLHMVTASIFVNEPD